MAGNNTVRRLESQRYFTCEVAPSMLMMTRRRMEGRCSRYPRMETILEEGHSEVSAEAAAFQKGAIYFLPIPTKHRITYYFRYAIFGLIDFSEEAFRSVPSSSTSVTIWPQSSMP
ncbi:hypothetical protein SAY87_003479 [Trapa incisa]|uniref:Uncharacterized protein n=1 Tax=Trapa incisa TaxID=236973 RepID=A0AAN7KPA6_9MYRT|nr:hypothetical protein SAY87_003479 [Trapa incisa]